MTIKQLSTMVKNLIKRGKVSLVGNDSGNFARTQVTYMGRTKNIEVVFPYGLAASLPKDAIVLLFNVQAQEENIAGIGNTPQTRFKNLKEGEVVVGSPKFQTFIKFAQDGSVEIKSTDKLNINCADCDINASGSINLGTGGQPIARQGDPVQVNTGTGLGTITQGSTKNKSA